jgi:tetratricopeptide (TPR) repeat protein
MIRRSLFSALALLLASTVSAQNNTIRGKVRSSTGAVVNNAIVELRIGGGGMIGQTVTRNEGDFAFSNLVSGEYEIAVTMAGFEPAVQTARFNLASNLNFMETIRVEVIINPKSPAAPAAPGTSFAQDVPRPARAAYEKALARLQEGKSTEAVALLTEAIKQFDDYFDAHFALGKELFRAGKDDEAIKALERARQINDREAAVYHVFGLVMLKQQKFSVADYAFSEATRLNPNVALFHFYRGQTLIEMAARESDLPRRAANLGEAEKELNAAWELSEKRLNAVYLQRSRIHERRGNKEAAALELEKYLRAEPEAKNAAAIRQAIRTLRGKNK